MNHIDFARELRKSKDKKVKEQSKQEREYKKYIEKEKKKLSKIIKNFKKEKYLLDKATEKIAFGLSHSSEDKHILLFNPLGITN